MCVFFWVVVGGVYFFACFVDQTWEQCGKNEFTIYQFTVDSTNRYVSFQDGLGFNGKPERNQ